MNKNGFFDPEVLGSAGFIILAVMAVSATLIGAVMAKRMDMQAIKTWHLIIIIAVEIMGAYFFAARG